MFSFPNWKQSSVAWSIPAVASWPAHKFLRRQVRWSGIPTTLRIFHNLLWSTQSKALAQSIKQKQMFLWTSLAFPMIQQMLAIWSLVPLPFLNAACISESSQFTYCRGLTLKDFEHNLAGMWNDCNCTIIWMTLPFIGIGMKTDLFQSYGHCCVFQICWHNECSTFTASHFRIWNNSAVIPSPPLALFVVVLPKVYLASHSTMSGFRRATTSSWLTQSLRAFLYSSVYSCYLFLISSASVRSLLFLSFLVPFFVWNASLVSPIFLKRSLVFPILLFYCISLH